MGFSHMEPSLWLLIYIYFFMSFCLWFPMCTCLEALFISAAMRSATPILCSKLPIPDPPILLIIQSLPNSLNVSAGTGLTPCMLFSSCYTGFEIISAWHYRDNLSLMQTCVFTILESLSCYFFITTVFSESLSLPCVLFHYLHFECYYL